MFTVIQTSNEFNDEVIDSVTCKVHKIKFIDSIDEIKRKQKWTDLNAK